MKERTREMSKERELVRVDTSVVPAQPGWFVVRFWPKDGVDTAPTADDLEEFADAILAWHVKVELWKDVGQLDNWATAKFPEVKPITASDPCWNQTYLIKSPDGRYDSEFDGNHPSADAAKIWWLENGNDA